MSRRRPAMRWLAALVVLGCSAAAADHETLGDERYAAGRPRDALAEYELALQGSPRSPDLLAKTGLAALRSQVLGRAIEAYAALAEADDDRRPEAAAGLWQVVVAASGDDAMRTAAVGALREVDPEFHVGEQIKALALAAAVTSSSDAADLLLQAAASVEGQVADSLLFAFGTVAAQAGRCEEAVAVFEGLLRRRRAPEVEEPARAGAAQCALTVGRRAMENGDPDRAEVYLRRATSPAAPSDIARAAWLELGEVVLERADTQAALTAFREALAGRAATADAIAGRASRRLTELLGFEVIPQ